MWSALVWAVKTWLWITLVFAGGVVVAGWLGGSGWALGAGVLAGLGEWWLIGALVRELGWEARLRWWGPR